MTLFSGVPNVRLEASIGEKIYLSTFTSTSADRAVAEDFADDGGVILEFDKNVRYGLSVDVSWISKFPSEREVLRAVGAPFTVKSVEIVGGQQHIVLGWD